MLYGLQIINFYNKKISRPKFEAQVVYVYNDLGRI